MLSKFLIIPSAIEGTQGHLKIKKEKRKLFKTPFNPCDYFSLLAAHKMVGLIFFFFHLIYIFISDKDGSSLVWEMVVVLYSQEFVGVRVS